MSWPERILEIARAPAWRQRALAAALAAAALALAGALAAWIVPLPARLDTGGSAVVTWRDGRPAHVFLAKDDRWRVGITLDQVDPHYVEALLALEDQRFWHHPGVDPIAIVRAARSNLTQGRIVSGASTITMQLVRVLEPRPRTLRSKIIEALRAMQLELRFSKAEILEMYLRFAPYGRNIEGLDAASMAYFGHRADALSNAEIATLLAVPQAPNARYPSPANRARLERGRDEVAAELFALGALDLGDPDHQLSSDEALAQVRASDVPLELTPFPRAIPHAASWLRARYPDRADLPTTLDRGTQGVVERMMRERRADYARRGIHNGAAVVLDHTTGQVRALVGNFDFRDQEHAGQIPGFDVPRSTGSLLKPLILGMAIDEAMVHPGMLAHDVPMVRGDWRPSNFDERFHGLVRLDDALTRSLNIPFIRLIEQIGPDALLARLRRADFAHLNEDPGHYGLGIAVGGVEATPLEIAGLYGALARRGQIMPTQILAPEPAGAGSCPAPASARLLGEAASWLVLEVMDARERPDLPWRATLPEGDRAIHWKTGTSNGHRDAWSAGSSGELTAVIWLGNYSNASSSDLVGARVAAPVMFDVLEALTSRGTRPPAPPEGLKELEVCRFSGHRPGPACPETTTAQVPTESVPMRPCPYHRHIEVDASTGQRVRPACRAQRTTAQESVIDYPTEVLAWVEDGARAQASLPAWAPGCQPPSADRPPKILSPARRHTVLLIPGIPADRQRVPLKADSPLDAPLSWFVDGEFLGDARPGQTLWWTPSPGDHELVVTDASGRARRRELTVSRRRIRGLSPGASAPGPSP